jgi:hypothetical protein
LQKGIWILEGSSEWNQGWQTKLKAPLCGGGIHLFPRKTPGVARYQSSTVSLFSMQDSIHSFPPPFLAPSIYLWLPPISLSLKHTFFDIIHLSLSLYLFKKVLAS